MLNKIIFFILISFFCFNNLGSLFAEQELEVTGIMQGGEPLAVVNGKVVKKGDKIGEAEVTAVGQDSVDFKINNEVVTKPIKKAENAKPQPKKDTISILFAGLELKDMDKGSAFELKDDEDCSINIVSRAEVEPVIAKFYRRGDYLHWFIVNNTDLPVDMNYYMDEYYLMDRQGKSYKFSVADISHYPDFLNPDYKWERYMESIPSFENKYTRLDNIAFIYCLIDGRTRAIVLKPCPSPQNK